mgnify:CR=1 FL=1
MDEFNFKENEVIYVVDTSALIKLESTFPPNNIVFNALWEEIEEMISYRQFVTIDFVEEEINNYEGKELFLQSWIKKYKKLLVKETDIDTFNEARPIIKEEYVTGFFDAKKLALGKEEADPYLIAYCKVHKCVLITNENQNKPNKIPAVAKKNGVRCINIYDFLEERGLILKRKQR